MKDQEMGRGLATGDETQVLSAQDDFTTPLGSAVNGRLVFVSGAAALTLNADPALPALYQAHFERHAQRVRAQDGIVTVQYPRRSFLDWLTDLSEPLAHVTLNGTIPWEIELRDGASHLTADLRRLHLRALDLGSISGSTILLPQPAGAVFVYVYGSASDLTIQRPAGVAARVDINGSASRLSLDNQRFGAVAGGIHWQTPDYSSAAGHYEISITGSVSNLTVASR